MLTNFKYMITHMTLSRQSNNRVPQQPTACVKASSQILGVQQFVPIHCLTGWRPKTDQWLVNLAETDQCCDAVHC